MPVFRYFLVMGCCLLGLIFATGWMWPNAAVPESAQPPVASASTGLAAASLASTNPSLASTNPSLASTNPSLASTNPSLASTNPGSTNLGSLADWRRSEKRLDRRKHDQAVVYPDVAPLAPTADRLQWERQLRYLPENHVYEARAEMPKEMSKTVEAPKVAAKKAPVHKHIARAPVHARIAANVERQPRPNFARNIFARNNGWDPFGLFD